MLNEKRVKHMVKLAMYESKDGAEELQVSSYYKKDYISFNILWSVVLMTIAYLLVVVLVTLSCIPIMMNNFSMDLISYLAIAFVAVYILLLITYITVSKKHYRKKHARAYHRVKRFKEGLAMLDDMYREEKNNG